MTSAESVIPHSAWMVIALPPPSQTLTPQSTNIAPSIAHFSRFYVSGNWPLQIYFWATILAEDGVHVVTPRLQKLCR